MAGNSFIIEERPVLLLLLPQVVFTVMIKVVIIEMIAMALAMLVIIVMLMVTNVCHRLIEKVVFFHLWCKGHHCARNTGKSKIL